MAQGGWSELVKRKSPGAAGHGFADYGCPLVLGSAPSSERKPMPELLCS